MEPDFSGWATKAGVRCSDGRTIAPNAFAHMHGATVPLVWQHGHDKPTNVLGHAVLEHREDGIYAYGFFNDTEQGVNTKALVLHGDVRSLSIYANRLRETTNKLVEHGDIREVSLVLAGANPKATIDFVRIKHGADTYEDLDDEAIVRLAIELEHTGLNDQTDETDNEESQMGNAATQLQHADGDETVQDIVETLNEKQRNVFDYMIGLALEEGKNSSAEHSDDATDSIDHQEGTESMNVFEEQAGGRTKTDQRHYISHDDVKGIVQDAIRNNNGSLRAAVESYAIKHGIDNIDLLFPDAQSIENMPQFNKRRTEWVTKVLNDTRHSPFSRVKTVVADLTQADARARGYIKGNYKIEEWFGLTKRVTTPTTIYKKQRLDRDDIVDIVDFDVVAWIKQEMRIMLDEELARAALLGDGRAVDDEDKIKDPVGAPAGDGIRSILNDHELFVTTVTVNVADANSSYDEVVDAVMDGMEYYKGTGTPTLYTTIKELNKFLKAKDEIGRRLYNNKSEVASAMGVADIVTVEPMNEYDGLIGIIVNLDDYTFGSDKGGEVTTFEDFDIDYNQQKYLIETRLSGALTRIKSAIVVWATTSGSDAEILKSDVTPPTYNQVTGVVTIPTVTHVTYKNADTGVTLSSGAQSALTDGSTLNVQAFAASGYFFANDADTYWTFYKRP